MDTLTHGLLGAAMGAMPLPRWLVAPDESPQAPHAAVLVGILAAELPDIDYLLPAGDARARVGQPGRKRCGRRRSRRSRAPHGGGAGAAVRNYPAALVNAARHALAIGDNTRARRHAERATRVAPRCADGWALLGVVEAWAGLWAEARRGLEHALALDPEQPDAKENLARLPR
jgi:tetratricopeptide (TPR) repeat protein